MTKERSEEIYQSLKDNSRDTLSGLVMLNRVRKQMKCTTEDVLISARMNSTKKIGNTIVHTSIFDFGIKAKDISISHLKDGKRGAFVPKDYPMRGITSE